jgi:hypothetical protein
MELLLQGLQPPPPLPIISNAESAIEGNGVETVKKGLKSSFNSGSRIDISKNWKA